MKIFKTHPHWTSACKICRRLQSEGFEALFAGGCVRDALLGDLPKDFDIATSARPDDIERLFAKVVGVGKSFGVMLVVEDGHSYEVASFRRDGTYIDGRRPDSIEFSSLEQDAERRDFTINAMYFDPIKEQLIDTVEGKADLKKGLIRTVGDPRERFTEDHLRILRAIRFASRFGFQIEPQTWKAIVSGAQWVEDVSKERITEELSKIWVNSKRSEGFLNLVESVVLKFVLPEAYEAWLKKSDQDQKLSIKLFSGATENDTKAVLWATFFLLFKVEAFALYQKSLPRLVFSRLEQKTIEFSLLKLPQITNPSLRDGEKLEWLGGELGMDLLRVLEIYSQTQDMKPLKAEMERLLPRLAQVMSPKGDLPLPLVKGEDLIRAGIKKGPQMGALLKEAYFLQLEGRLVDRQQGLEFIKAYTSNEV